MTCNILWCGLRGNWESKGIPIYPRERFRKQKVTLVTRGPLLPPPPPPPCRSANQGYITGVPAGKQGTPFPPPKRETNTKGGLSRRDRIGRASTSDYVIIRSDQVRQYVDFDVHYCNLFAPRTPSLQTRLEGHSNRGVPLRPTIGIVGHLERGYLPLGSGETNGGICRK